MRFRVRLVAAAVMALLPTAMTSAALAQTTYTWNQTGTASWATSTNWTPTRTTPATNDILVFSGGGTVTATGVPTQTIGRLVLSGSSAVNLQAAAAATILTIGGGSGTDLDVPVGSALNINGANTTTITLSSGATGSISGNMTFTTAAHRLDAADASAITFNSGAVLTQGTGCTGNIFTAAGTANAIVFASGSTFIQQAGANPFGLTAPASKCIFQTGGLFRIEQNSAPSFSGRSYANLQINFATFNQNGTGTGGLSIDNLTVTLGSLGLGMTGANQFNLKGNVSVASGATLNFNPASAGTLNFSGTSAQTISNSGTLTFNANQAVVVSNATGVTALSAITLLGTTTVNSGASIATSATLTNSGTLNINGTFQLNAGGATAGNNFAYGLSSTLILNNSAQVTVGGAGSQFWPTLPGGPINITVQSGGGALLSASRTINGTLGFVSGKIETGSNVLVLGPSSSVTGASGVGYVYGNLQKFVLTGSPTRSFEIGDVSNYTPVGLAFSGVTGADNVTARTDAGDLSSPSGSGLDYSKSVNRNWTVTAGGALAFGSCTGTFNFINPGDLDGGANTGNFVVRKLDGSTWSPTTTVAQNSTNTSASWTSGFSRFAVGELAASPPSLSETHVNVSCFGGSNGSIDLTVTGGTAPFTYLWGDGPTTEDRSGLTAGTYSVTVTDALSQTANTSVTITQPTALALSETHTNVTTCGGSNGTIDLSVSGGTAPYTYLWGDGPTTEDRSGLSAGSYSVTVTDANSCTASTSVTITEPSPPTLSETHVNVACFGNATGSIDLSVSGGTAPFTYLWGDGPTTEDRSGLSAGSYSVTVTDANGCTASTSVTITQPAAALSLSETHVNVSCFGGSNGSIDLSVTGGTAPYTYLWGDGPTIEDRSGLSASSYSVTVTDANGCTASTSVTISQPAELLLSETHTNVTTCGGSNGSIDLSVAGGTAPYAYLWSDGPTIEDRSGLSAGSYSVTVTDANGCTASTSVTITAPAGFTLSETHVNVSCFGGSNGSIDLSVAGGTAPFMYLWSDGPTSEDRSGLSAGSYSVTVTDANGCTASTSVTITQPAALTLSETHVNVSCFGGSNGSIDLSVAGGTAPFTYLWSDGPTTEDRSGLSAGSYSVTVTDANGCTANTSVTISQPAELTLSETHVNVSCFGGSNGSIDLSVTGGTAPYTYLWGDGPTTEDRSGLSAGSYSVTVTDANGCTASTSVTITQPAALTLSETHVNVSCFGGSNGSIDLSVTGGTAPFTYLWGDGPTTEDRSGLSAGSYSVTVTDANDCTASTSVTITQPAALTLSETHTNVTTCSGSNGSIDLSVSGGTASYTYAWNDGPTTEDRSGLSAGSYSVTVTDDHGCTESLTITITAPSAPTLSETHSNVSCFGGSNGSIDLTVSGGTAPFTYLWSDGPTTEDRSGLSAGAYSVTVTDANGCTASTSVTITQPAAALTLNEAHVDVSCYGGSEGTIDLSVSGGTAPYSYLWSDGPTTQDRSGLSAGSYSVTVTDDHGCTASTSVTITQPAALVLSETHVNVSCFGASDGSIDLSVSGGTAPYTYSWSDGPTSQDRSGLGPGTYTVTVTDDHGCTASLSPTITEPAALSLTETHVNVTTCGGSNGSIDLSVAGGTAPYTYLWSNGATTQDLSGLSVSTYSVTVTDDHGCTATTSVTLTGPASFTLSESHVNASCHGVSDASVNLTVNGGAAPFTYLWSNGATTQDLSGIANGIYSVTVTDANNCSVSLELTVGVRQYTIVSSKGPNGSISPLGSVAATCGLDLTFNIQPSGGYEIDELKVDGANVTPTLHYTFVEVAANHTIHVTFKQIVVTGVVGAPGVLALGSVMPNPAPGAMQVPFSLSNAGHANVSVVDVQGREVAVLARGDYPAGLHMVSWRGDTDHGPAAAGMYFVRFQAAGRTFVKRFALTR
jgi:SprB-like repeat protein